MMGLDAWNPAKKDFWDLGHRAGILRSAPGFWAPKILRYLYASPTGPWQGAGFEILAG
jgi:hypothetical protein